MKIGAAFPGKYIKAADLGQAKPVVVIDRVVFEDVAGDGKQKPVLHFKGKDRGLVLNKTNANTIAFDIVGDDETDNWPGHKLRLFATKTEFQGKRVDCIRVEPVEAPKPKTEEPGEDEVPF